MTAPKYQTPVDNVALLVTLTNVGEENGDALEWGVWGLVSHGSANMLNMPTMAHPDEVLNSGDPGNSGANCGTPQGCNSVNVRVLVYAGDALISVLETTVTK